MWARNDMHDTLQDERHRSPGRGERLSISKPRGPRLRVQRLVIRLLHWSQKSNPTIFR